MLTALPNIQKLFMLEVDIDDTAEGLADDPRSQSEISIRETCVSSIDFSSPKYECLQVWGKLYTVLIQQFLRQKDDQGKFLCEICPRQRLSTNPKKVSARLPRGSATFQGIEISIVGERS